MADRITGRLDDGTVFVHSETGNEGVGHFTTQRRLPEICCKLANLEDKIENGELVEVVRCKDCRYYEIHKPNITLNCERDGKLIPMNPDDFCSYGERKENE